MLVCLITATPTRGGVCRVEPTASPATDLERPAEIMVEKVGVIPRAQIGDTIGLPTPRGTSSTIRTIA